jgi:PHP family Zn ribbon phosphoesterase
MNDTGGAGFRKTDLHVHTPASACFGDKSVTPEQIVEAAIAMGLELIAITDHNTVSAIDDIRRSAAKKNLIVFPGVELSTKEGHVVALFERDEPASLLEDLLDTVGVSREGRGDAGTLAEKGMASVCQQIIEKGGLSIAAHIERWPSGFLESNSSRSVKMKIHSSPYLSALEITIPQNRSKWNSGTVRGFPKKYPCIQASDAHALSDIGRRPVYIRMDHVDLAGLGNAFKAYACRIKFPDD